MKNLDQDDAVEKNQFQTKKQMFIEIRKNGKMDNRQYNRQQKGNEKLPFFHDGTDKTGHKYIKKTTIDAT